MDKDLAKQIQEAFVEGVNGNVEYGKTLMSLNNDSDLFVLKMSGTRRGIIRSKFSISYDEEILFFRDTSSWNNSNQGLVITTLGLYILVEYNKPEDLIMIPWEMINYFEFKDDCMLLFYDDDNDENTAFEIHKSYFFKSFNSTFEENSFSNYLASLLTKISNLVEPDTEMEDMMEEIENLIEKEKYDDALRICNELESLEGDSLWLRFQKLDIAVEQDDSQKMISEGEVALQFIQNDETENEVEENFWNDEKAYVLSSIGFAFADQKNYSDARKYFLSSLEYANSDMRSTLQEEFILSDDAFMSSFSEMKYNKRRLIVPVSKFTSLDTSLISVLDINKLDDFQFPSGHPIANELYVCHPYLINNYIPFDDHELVFLEDRIREFSWFAQALGASSISIESISDNTEDNRQDSTRAIKGEAGRKFLKAEGSYDEERKNAKLEELKKRLTLQQHFIPHSKPFIPDDLVWYEFDSSWKRLATQRLQGGLLEHQEVISLNKNRVVESDNLLDIKAEFEGLFLKAKGSYNSSNKGKFQETQNLELRIHIKFMPINQIQQQNSGQTALEDRHTNENLLVEQVHTTQTSNGSDFTEDEKEYMAEYESCLDSEGNISDSEKRLLNVVRRSMGITEEREKELINSWFVPSMTEDELAYISEYKECLKTGDLTDSENRLLNRVRKMLNITDERAKELEATVH